MSTKERQSVRCGERYKAAVNLFPARLRPVLSETLQFHERHEQLMESFPAACVAIADRRRPPQLRGEALWLARTGGSREEIAKALDIPLMLKRFGAEDLPGRIPLALGYEEPEPGFFEKLVRRAPRRGQAREWLRRLFDLVEAAPPDVVLWAAGVGRPARGRTAACPRLVALYTYYSRQPDLEAHRFIERPWSPAMSWRGTVQAAEDWFVDLLFASALDLSDLPSALYRQSVVMGAIVTPLLHPRDIEAEGKRMRHCIAQYARAVLIGRSLLFRIESPEGERANFELRLTSDKRLAITQMKGPRNREPSGALQKLARLWVRERLGAKPERCLPLRLAIREDRWDRLWAPYWRAFGAGAGAPERPRRGELVELIDEARAA